MSETNAIMQIQVIFDVVDNESLRHNEKLGEHITKL